MLAGTDGFINTAAPVTNEPGQNEKKEAKCHKECMALGDSDHSQKERRMYGLSALRKMLTHNLLRISAMYGRELCVDPKTAEAIRDRIILVG